MFHVKIFEIDGLLGRERVEDTLEQGPMLIAMHPMLIQASLHLLELEAGVRVKGKP